jgi:hypothetical protein
MPLFEPLRFKQGNDQVYQQQQCNDGRNNVQNTHVLPHKALEGVDQPPAYREKDQDYDDEQQITHFKFLQPVFPAGTAVNSKHCSRPNIKSYSILSVKWVKKISRI